MSILASRFSRSRRILDAAWTVCGICAALALSAFAGAQQRTPSGPSVAGSAEERVELGYTLNFEGVGAEGIDNIWKGPLVGAPSGEVTVRLTYRGAEIDRAKPQWPVSAIVFVAADSTDRSFAAELEGTLDWASGSLRLSGGITEGWMKGAAVWQEVQLDRKEFDGAGTLTVGLVTAKR